MRCKAPDKRFYRELTDLNGEFLLLLAHSGRFPGGGPALGLDAAVRAQLRDLSPGQLRFIAETPTLLAGFATWPPVEAVAENDALSALIESGWLESARMFSAGLMTYLWQMARRDPLNAVLCIGDSAERIARFADLSFRDIQSSARSAVRQLEARFCRHPRFWADLIRITRAGNGINQRMSRLSGISLGLAGRRPNTGRRRPPSAPYWS